MTSDLKTYDLDDQIRARLASGDSSALDMIWDQYSSDILGYLVSMLCNRHDAEDTLQDLFITVARKRDTVAKARRLKGYLFRLARNTALNRIKKRKRRWDREIASTGWLESMEEETPDARTEKLEGALASLPGKQRTVVILKYYQEKSFREIAEMLGISENTAGSRYRYGMAKLKDLMREAEHAE